MMYTYSKVGNTETLSNKIQSEIEKSILQKKFIPGDKLPTEKEMCEMFGVSRTALREALQMLSIQGLITIRKGSGIYVSEYNSSHAIKPMSRYLEMNLDSELIIQVVEVRKMFEPQIAWMAARNRNEADVKFLEKNLSDLKKSDALDSAYQGEIDQNFHLRICEATKNPIIALQMDPIFRLMPRIRTIVYSTVDNALSEAVDFHQKIFDAIQDQDAEGAREAMMGHLAVAEEHSYKILNQ
ncbi:MAG: FadR family transcriptional regulator [Candidatus Marinimicrobia bacterium]|jgi:GntR family transcriptional regulator, transcriptional repressor for pyruvate dehydrogenase complex|nr:FadR family transcriptional regulator [Candidatus Neomarinimicrobiota bacterium]MBT4035314.1 FadR family transcriptional regulator [Candidatus Neomarinimicrobiota bacterium]MBT4359713.1 FadR family transcriptional regulator [Candidatus Neomarinimicrobiota bacterium]MBT4713725.1 FadR family transcriptional regulator [Candidatus Neomarinimicrobiota bacterium]MBT4946923.1 FadR family transcriptional regulator [Candidatus Neomarinimicrobiota bacterium]